MIPRMAFPDQICIRCLQPVALEAATAEVDEFGKLIGWRHDQCLS